MKFRTFLCLLLALTMIAGMAAVSQAEGNAYPEYLNLEGYYPLVKEGSDITIRVTTLQDDGHGTDNPNDYWFFAWTQKYLGIKMDIEMIPNSAWGERKNLMFAGGDLPDLMLCMGLNTSDLVTYGEANGQLLDWNPYINEDLTPAMVAWFDYYPTMRASVTCAGGGLYSLPNTARPSDFGGTATRFFINYKWLQECGLEEPETLDEFIGMLRAFKAAYPDCIPLAGGYGSDSSATASSAVNPCYPILNALGYVTKDAYGLSPALRDGKVVLPAGDEYYLHFLEIMKMLYDEGLVSQDMFTMDSDQFKALALENKLGAIGEAPIVYYPDTWNEWESLRPLTSEYSDVKQWGNSGYFSIGHFVISADTKYPELLVRMGDWCLTDDGNVFCWGGPQKGVDDDMGLCGGWYIDEDKKFHQQDVDDGKYSGNWDYYINECYPNGGFAQLGNSSGFSLENQETHYSIKWERGGYPNYDRPLVTTNGDNYFRISQLERLSDYVTDVYPGLVFFPEDINTRIGDLKTVINSYVRAETAKFITGARPLDQFNDYLAELESLGLSEYIGYYAEYYEAYKANMG